MRQLRLRDIGGIIVIDFIDMANPKNRATVEEALRNELERDRTKTYVVEISPLGLVEMTRQNVTDGPREILTKKCPTCAGDGIVVSEATAAMEVERRLRQLAAGSRAQAFRVEVAPRTASLLVGSGGTRLAEIEAAAKKRFFLVPKEGAHADHAAVLAEGKLDDLRPETPVAEGKELQLQLVELGLHDAGAAVGKLDGLDVVVGGAAKLVGKKAKVRIERVLDGTAYATLLAGGAAAAEPITFESEAEKPTRAPARAKKAAEEPTAAADESDVAAPEDEAVEADEVVGEAEPESEGEPEAEAAETGETAEGETPAKKKTRRGSRGGRGRKKKPASAGEDGDAPVGEQLPETVAEAPQDVPGEPERAPAAATRADAEPKKRAPRIHVPRADLGEPVADAEAPAGESEPETSDAESSDAETSDPETGEPKPKKKTRRGSRGGRGRKKKPATAAVSENGAEPEAALGAGDEVSGPEPDLAESEPTPAPVAAEAAPVPEPARTGDDDVAGDDYVPMSEWLDELEAETR